MDRQLAQRMVGAACLLAVLVLVVPAILDGNPESGARVTHPVMDDSLDLRTHTIRLDGDDRLPPVPMPAESPPPAAAVEIPTVTASEPPAPPAVAEPATPPAAAPAEVPPPVVETRRVAPGALPKEPVRSLAREPVVATAVPQPKASSAPRGSWYVQLGSFSQRANADRLVAELKRKGFPATLEAGGGANGAMYRVRTTPVHDRAAADALAGQLKSAGFTGGRVGQQ